MSVKVAFDPDKTWGPIEERMEKEKNPRKRKLLGEVRDHMRAEITGKFDELMDTLTDDPQYHLWGLPVEMGPKGREAVATFYKNMFEAGGNRFHFDIRRIVVDEGAVVTEGAMIQPMVGATLIAAGIETVEASAVDPTAEYLSEWQILTVWPGDKKGKLIGEDIYMGSPPMGNVRRA